MKQAIGDFLLRRLEEVGVRHIFGVPGDYNLEFMQQLEDRGRPAWVGNCNELNASYAADGYARLNGLAALIVTNGVGALSAINGIAGSFCEHLPVICICGSLPRRSIEQNLMMHHTLANEGHNNFLRAYAEVTVAQAQLTPQNASKEIDRIITTAWQRKRPAYIELPSDIAYLEVEVPSEPLELAMPESDTERLQAAADLIVSRIGNAKAPAMLLDMDAERFDVRETLSKLAEKMQAPVATMGGSKSAFEDASPLALGIYQGAGNAMEVRDAIEKSDCLLTVGYRRVDSTSGFFTSKIPENAIHLRDTSVISGQDNYQGIALKELLEKVLSLVPAVTEKKQPQSKQAPPVVKSSEPLRQKEYWAMVQAFLKPGDVLLAEDGTSSSGASSLELPEGCTFITQAIWGSIGYTLGSLLGTLCAAPERRHLLFIGDGSFQLTAQELSTILRHELKPYIFLINNRGYTIERTILGLKAKYNDVADWQYSELVKVFRANGNSESFVVKTADELDAVLHSEHKGLVFIESHMSPDDAPVGLIKGGHASAYVDYGPRGPQSRADSQIPVPE